MKRVTPDGSKISSIRSSKGIKQLSLAHDIGISDRQMRAIERKNASVSEDVLIKIANLIGSSPDEIKFKPKVAYDNAKPVLIETKSGSMKMKLVPFSSGGDIFNLAQYSSVFNYQLNVDPNSAAADVIVQLLDILKCRALGARKHSDGFEDMSFPDVYRISKLYEAIKYLNDNGISVSAGIHYRLTYGKREDKSVYRDQEKRFYVGFSKLGEDIEVSILRDEDPPADFDPNHPYVDVPF